jgi:hypothetical protein
MDALYIHVKSMEAPHGLFLLQHQVPGAITRFQLQSTCSGLSVLLGPLVALLKRALASTLPGGAVELLSHYGGGHWPWRGHSYEAWWEMELMSRTIVIL